MPLGRSRRVRRRRAAMVAGGAYAVHKHHEHQQDQALEQEDQEQDQGQGEVDAAAATPVAEAPVQDDGAASGDDMSRLTQLKSLLDSGALTQEEFDAEKQKILGI